MATATLIKAVQDGKIEADATVMLNITGAGEQAFKSSHDVHTLAPTKIFPLTATEEEVITAVEEMFREER